MTVPTLSAVDVKHAVIFAVTAREVVQRITGKASNLAPPYFEPHALFLGHHLPEITYVAIVYIK